MMTKLIKTPNAPIFPGRFLLQKFSNYAIILDMTRSKQIQEKSVFIDVQGTLIKSANTLNRSLYNNMQHAQQRGANVVIFTMAAPSSMAKSLDLLGVDTKRFPVVNKFKYRGHLFTGLIVDDIAPHLQGFQTRPHVYDPNGSVLASIVKQLQNSPDLTFDAALKSYRGNLNKLHIKNNLRS